MPFPSESEGLAASERDRLPGLDAKLADEMRRIARSVVREEIPPAIEGYRRSSGLTDEVAELLQLLEYQSGEPRGVLLKKALTLYSTALDYVGRGDRLAILSPDDTIVREVVGIKSAAVPTPVVAN